MKAKTDKVKKFHCDCTYRLG